MSKIAKASLELYNRGALKDKSGFCLAFVRMCVERAHGLDSHEWYQKQVTAWVQPEGYNRSYGHWARDAERSLRNLGLQIPNRDIQRGDIVCKYDSAQVTPSLWRLYFPNKPYQAGVHVGHIGIYLGDMLILKSDGTTASERVVIENINPRYREGRRIAHNGALSLSTWSAWPSPTSVFRVEGTL